MTGDSFTDVAAPFVTAVAAVQARSHELRAAAATLRHEAEDLPRRLGEVGAFDRDDVWQGRRADEHRARWRELEQQVTSPWSGIATQLLVAAARLERRAQAIELAAAPGSS